MPLLDRNRPPSAPMRRVGRPAIEAFRRDIRARGMTHEVGQEVIGADRLGCVERRACAGGCHAVPATMLGFAGGRIVRIWRCGPQTRWAAPRTDPPVPA